MLACRSVLVDLDDVPTLIFDEVDAGIGGRGRGRRRATPREPRARPSGRRGDPPAADRVVRRPAHPGPQGRRDGLDRGVGRRRAGRGALAGCSPDCPGATPLPPTPRSCCPRPVAAAKAPSPVARDGPSGVPVTGIGVSATLSRARAAPGRRLRRPNARSADDQPERSKTAGRRPRSERSRGACSGGRCGGRSRRPASRASTRGPSGCSSASAGRDRGDRPRGPRPGLGRGADRGRGRRRRQRGALDQRPVPEPRSDQAARGRASR